MQSPEVSGGLSSGPENNAETNDSTRSMLTSLRHYPGHVKTHPIIVHSHLRWDGVWQRPQQLLSRFVATHRVLFVEGP